LLWPWKLWVYDVRNIIYCSWRYYMSLRQRYSLLTNFRCVPLSFLTRIRLNFFFSVYLSHWRLKAICIIIAWLRAYIYYTIKIVVLYKTTVIIIILYIIIASDSKRCHLITTSMYYYNMQCGPRLFLTVVPRWS